MKGYIQHTKLQSYAAVRGTWARADPSPATRGNCSVVVDQKDAAGLDLAEEGFTQMYADVPIDTLRLDEKLTSKEIVDELFNAPLPPTDRLIAAVGSPYRLDLVRSRDYDPDKPEQPAIMGAVWPTPHPPQWLAELQYGLMVIVVPDIRTVTQKYLGPQDLQHAWFAATGVASALR